MKSLVCPVTPSPSSFHTTTMSSPFAVPIVRQTHSHQNAHTLHRKLSNIGGILKKSALPVGYKFV